MRYLLALTIALLSLQGCVGERSLARTPGETPRVATESSGSQELSSFSPSEIKKFVGANGDVNLNPIWNFYGVKPEPFERYNQPYISYAAEVLPVALDSDASVDDAFLRVSLGDSYRFLLFKGQGGGGGENGGWKYFGYVDIDAQRYAPPEPEVVFGKDGAWLSMKALWGRGTGVSLYGKTWYEISGDGKELKAVLFYPVQGHAHSCESQSASRSFDSKMIEHGEVQGNYEVRVEFSVSYDVGGCGGRDYQDKTPFLFSKTQKATYVRNAKAGKFVLAKAKSELSIEEIEAVYYIDSLDDEGFLKYNFQELMNLASRGDVKQKEWLRHFLLPLPDSKRKRALGTALAQ
jgi:hypothetical protein